MTNKEAITVLNMVDAYGIAEEAKQMAIQALENIGHLKDRPCSACEFRKENGCCKWDCVFKGV